MTMPTSRILIIGGGFAGVWAALAAARQSDINGSNLNITLISKDDYLTIRPRLYQKKPDRLRVPLRLTLDPARVSLICATVNDIDAANHRITLTLAKGETDVVNYDRLILAAGSEGIVPPVTGMNAHTFSIDTYKDALALDQHLKVLAAAPADEGTNCFVIIGSGISGIEMATELRGRIAEHSNSSRASAAQIVIIERNEQIGSGLGLELQAVIIEALASTNVDVRLNTQVTHADANGITLDTGDRIKAKTIILAAGLRANTLNTTLGQPLDASGRLPVDEMLRVKGIPDVYAAGDVAKAYTDDKHLALMSCQHAMPMGRFAGHNAARDIAGLDLQPYRQPNYATCIDLGESGAVYTTGWERTVEKTGTDAKALKNQINEQWIYPPTGTREQVLANAGVDS